MPMTEQEFRCKGRKKDGRPCRTLFFKGWMSDAYISVVCHKCNCHNTWADSQQAMRATVDSAALTAVS